MYLSNTKVALRTILLAASLATILHVQSSSSSVPTDGVDAFIPASKSYRANKPSAARVTASSFTKRSSSLSYAASLPLEIHGKTVSFLQSDGVLRKKRQQLKRRLLDAVDEYKIHRQIDELFEGQKAHARVSGRTKSKEDDLQEAGRYSVARILRSITSKIAGRRDRKTSGKRSKSVITTDKFRQKKLEMNDNGRAIIDLAQELIKFNPTPNPTHGFAGYDGGDPTECQLGGRWKLRFTTAADATFERNEKRGKTSTSQEVDCVKGTLTNVVDFETGKLDGFRVVVEGTPVSDTELDLTFQRVQIMRKSHFPRWFGKISFRLPSRLLRRLNRDKEERGPYLTIKYLDDDLRIHQSGTGNFFIQSRVR